MFSGIVAISIASTILTRNSSHPANRLVAAILGCSAYWSFLEVIWNSLDEARWVPWLIRISSFGWMPLGVLCLHLFMVLSGGEHPRLRRLLPVLYGTAAVSILLYIATPWGIADVHRTPWGWSYSFGPLFLAQYLPPALLCALSLAVLWRHVYPADGPPNERRQGYYAFAGIAVPLCTASTTDAILPLFDVHVPRLGSASLVLVGATVAWSMHRYGYALLAPGTFAPEILATLRDGVALVRLDERVRSANASLARLVGCAPRDLPGRAIRDFLPQFPKAAGAEVDEFECELVQHSGQPIPVSLSCSTLRDKQGEPVGRVLSVRDLREVAALRRSLIVAGRLAAVGELAAGISHEINNPMAFIQSNLTQLDKHWDTLQEQIVSRGDPSSLQHILDEGEELIGESLAGVKRVTRIVQDVRAFSHAGDDRQQTADVQRLIDDSLRMAAPRLRYHARLERDFASVDRVRCNPQELQQVFLNIVMNAVQAVEEGGRIRVVTRQEDGNVVVLVEDDGCGIPAEILDRIFDPFFTTKRVGEGTGLGLFLSYQMIRKHGGDIRVESSVGRGSCFEIRLPVEADQEEKLEPMPDRES
jgi:signal transduction histidine kinase